MTSFLVELQNYLVVKIKDAVALYSVSVPVFFASDDRVNYPYIEINSLDCNNTDIINADLCRHVLRVNVWSNERGNKEVLEIMELVRAGLHRGRTKLSSIQIADISISSMSCRKDMDGITFTGYMIIEIYTSILNS